MTIQEIISDLETSINLYSEGLKNYSSENFTHKKDESIWSLNQMYEHLVVSSNFYFLANVLRCSEQRKGQEGGKLTEYGLKAFKYNSFPPIKIKMPDAMPQPANNIHDVTTYGASLQKILTDAQALANKIDSEGTYKVVHFAFGALNGKEWLQLLAMHFRHHLTQKAELEA